jgi:hypothetical protein
VKASTAVTPPQQLQRLSLEGMAIPDDRHPVGIAVEVVVGSVSSVPSIRFRTNG